MQENSPRIFRFALISFMMTGLVLAADIRYQDGRKVEGDYIDGKKNGVWSYFNTCGEKVRQETYQADILNGPAYRWDDDGFLLSEENWKMGKRHGRSVQYWITGALSSEGMFNEGTGKMTGWSPSGKKKSEQEYVNGKEIGKHISWSENGQKAMEYTRDNSGKIEGNFIFYRSNGQKAIQFEYQNGILQKEINFDEMGNKIKEFIFKIGYVNGRSMINAPLNSEDGLGLMYDGINKQYIPFPVHGSSEPCTYLEIPGSARITAIQPAGAGLNNCLRNPVVVLFDFTADDPHRSCKCMPNQHLTVGAGMNPSLDLVEKKGLKIGQMLRCIRKKIITGACSPSGFTFPELDLSDYAKWCF